MVITGKIENIFLPSYNLCYNLINNTIIIIPEIIRYFNFMHLATKVFYNTVVQIISKIIATILGLVAIAVITRYLGKFGFGQYTTIITFLSFFGIIADLGLTLVTTQMISQSGVDENLRPGKTSKILNNLFSLRLVSASLFLELAP